ncbi:MAG TPA: hypothetical protein PK156_25685, partial [Polyangium sp.]|nr:hypothetical protein [Polyangium sp.]
MRRSTLSLSLLVVAAMLSAWACGGPGPENSSGSAGNSSESSSSSSGSAAGGAGGDGGGIFIGHGPVVSLVVEPPTAIIDVQNEMSTPVGFHAYATYQDGAKEAIVASWSFERPDVALVDVSTGLLVASGKLGGRGILTATVDGVSATADVTVRQHVVENPAGLGITEMLAFDNPDPAPSGTLLYPYDKTVFGRGILAPEIMWNGGVAGDAWLVHLKEDFLDAKYFIKADPPSGFLMTEEFWNSLTVTNHGENVEVSIAKLSGGVAYSPVSETWKIAQGSLRGSIYYWAVNTGQLMKISPGSPNPALVFDSGPYDQLGTPVPPDYDNYQPPWSQGVNNKRCVACHVVSKDGSRLAALFERKQQTQSPWGTLDLTQPQPQVIQMTSYNSTAIYLGLSPDGKYAVENTMDMHMNLRDASTGALIPSLLDGFPDRNCDPAFSPDGKLLAFSSNVTGNYPVEFWRADLDVADFDAATTSFANRRSVVSAGNAAIAFPSFSPDSQWVVYQKGDYSRAKYGTSSVGHDDLYIADVAKTVGEMALDSTNGVGYLDPKNRQLNYQPTVNPIAVGGYFWVVFVSPRDYGNRMASATNPTYENRKQLWVAAIDVSDFHGDGCRVFTT